MGADRCIVRDNGRVISQAFSGTAQITGYGNHNITFTIEAQRRSTLTAFLEGVQIINKNNHSTRRVLSGYEECAQYQVPDARTTCRSGYRKTSQVVQEYVAPFTEYRERYPRDIGPIRSISRNVIHYTEWSRTRPNPRPRSCSGGTFSYCQGPGEIETRTNAGQPEITNYYCTPESNCRGDPIYNDEETNTGDYNGSYSTFVSYTPQELAQQEEDQRAADAREEAQRAEEEARRQAEEEARLRALEEAAQRAKEEQDAAIAAQNEAAAKAAAEAEARIRADIEALNQNIRQGTSYGQYVGDEARQNSQDTKYRIISPATYSIVNGKTVPDIRYESVRYLSPESVSNYVARGYEIQSVDPNTPTSTSKPYGQSIIQRSNILTPQASKLSSVERRDNRLTWKDITPKSQLPSVFKGNVQKRVNNRRVVS